MRWVVWLVTGLLIAAIPSWGRAEEREATRSLEEQVKVLMEVNRVLEERVKVLEERLNRLDKPHVVQQVKEAERVKALEERLDKLDKVDVIKQVKQYVCPGGEILESLPSGGRCPDGSLAEEQVTVKKFKFSRRESLGEKIEAALTEAEVRRVTVGGSVRGILQQPFHVQRGSKLVGEGSADLFLLSRPMAFSTVFVDFESIGGSGPDEAVGSRSRLNADAETLGPGVTDQVKVREAWLDLRLLDGRLDLVGGLLDLTNYFDRNRVANDETTQFLNGALVNNPMLKQPLNGGGLMLRYEPDRDMAVAFGVQSPNRSGATVANKLYGIAEFDYQLHLPPAGVGNYRVWGRFGRIADALDRDSWGVGVSVDQQLASNLTVFARAGVGRTNGDRLVSHAWSTGLQWSAPLATRIRDRIGLAFSRQVEPGGSESIGEAYYSLFLTDRLAVSADLQWLFTGPNSVTGGRNTNVLVPGARVTVSF
jgi:hypothetical protein